MSRKKMVTGWIQIIGGLLIFALGVHLTIRADLGLSPWDCFGMGIAKQTPLNYGLSMTVMGILILLIDVWMHEKIGFGTVLDALLTGNFVQIFNDLDTLPKTNGILTGCLTIVAGLALMSVGQYFYMSSAQCCGPRDNLPVGLGKRLRRFPIGAVQFGLLSMALLFGWMLGGPVGIGTIVSTFGAGIVMQIVFSLIKFEPRKIQHHSILEIVRHRG